MAGIVILMAACSKTAQTGGTVPEVAFEEAAPGYRIADSFDNVRAFQLELYDTCIVDKVRRIIDADDDRLLVVTQNELYAFDKNTGRFVNRIGNIGEGPEEYLNLTDLYYNSKDKTITIIDTYGKMLVRYGLFGDFVSKEKIGFPVDWFESVTRSDDGYMMISRKITGGALVPPSEYAFTVVEPNGESYSLDLFAPVALDGSYATAFANRPSVALGDRFTFFKFLNDTIFTMENGEISPEYKLSMKKPIPRKDVVAQMGDYHDCIMPLSISGDYTAGFDYIYETSKFIILVPQFFTMSGYYWIDKTNDSGVHFPSSSNYDLTMELLLKGESIFDIKGSNKNSLICAFDELSIGSAKKSFSKNPDLACFNEDVKAVFENADPEGNPVVVIYSH